MVPVRVELSPLVRFFGVIAFVATAGFVWFAANPGKRAFQSESLSVVKTPGIMVPNMSDLMPETTGSRPATR